MSHQDDFHLASTVEICSKFFVSFSSTIKNVLFPRLPTVFSARQHQQCNAMPPPPPHPNGMQGSRLGVGDCRGVFGDLKTARYAPYSHLHPPQLTSHPQINHQPSTCHHYLITTETADKNDNDKGRTTTRTTTRTGTRTRTRPML
jgi:hypothetical protein